MADLSRHELVAAVKEPWSILALCLAAAVLAISLLSPG